MRSLLSAPRPHRPLPHRKWRTQPSRAERSLEDADLLAPARVRLPRELIPEPVLYLLGLLAHDQTDAVGLALHIHAAHIGGSPVRLAGPLRCRRGFPEPVKR